VLGEEWRRLRGRERRLPGESTGGGGSTSGGGSTIRHQASGIRQLRPNGHRCLGPIKIGYVLALKTQGELKCRMVLALLDSQKARNQVAPSGA
jgi:hypothetical protein